MDSVARPIAKLSLEEALRVVRSKGWLSRQSARFQELLSASARLKSFAKNELLFHFDDEAPEIYGLVSGTAVIQVVHPVVGLLAGHVIHPGHWFGEPAALGRRPRLASVQARGPCQTVSVSRQAIENILQSDSRFSANFFDLMADNTEAYMLHAIDLLVGDPKVRLSARLLTLAGRRINDLPTAPVSVPLSQDELALTSCLSRKTVNALLADLVAEGICELHYREIRILDLESLVRMQDGS